MTNQEILQKLRRLHTLLVLGKRSNNLDLAIRRAIDSIESWRQEVDVMVARTPVKQIFAGYGPKFIKLFNELLETGDIKMIQDLQPTFDPFFCFLCEIPGIGETMARRMYYERSIHSMDDLRIAYTNNVLQRIPAFGDARLHAIEIVLWNSQSDTDLWNSLSSESLAELRRNEAEANSDNDNICNSMQLSLFEPRSFSSSAYSSTHSRECISDDSIRHIANFENENSNFQDDVTPDRYISHTSNANDISRQSMTTNSRDNSGYPGYISTSSANDISHISSGSTKFKDSISVDDVVCPAKEDTSYLSVDKANSAYSKAFRDSHSELFRDVQFQNSADDIPDELLVEDDLNDLLKQDQTPPTDPKLAAELGAFIQKDLQEHGIIEEDDKKATICDIPAAEVRENSSHETVASIIHVRVLHADRIDANVIHARLIRAQSIQMNSSHNAVSSSIVLQNDMMDVSSLHADVIHADIIEVKELHAQYIDARIMG